MWNHPVCGPRILDFFFFPPTVWCCFQPFSSFEACAASTGRCVNSTPSSRPAHLPAFSKRLSWPCGGSQKPAPCPHGLCREHLPPSGPQNPMCIVKGLCSEVSRVPSTAPSHAVRVGGQHEGMFSSSILQTV